MQNQFWLLYLGFTISKILSVFFFFFFFFLFCFFFFLFYILQLLSAAFYRRHFDIVAKYNVGLKTLLLQGLSEPEFYGDLVYKFRKIIGKIDFPYHFKKIIVRYKKIGYNINVMRQTACLVVNPIKVNSFAYLFNCTTVGRTSDWMTVPS